VAREVESKMDGEEGLARPSLVVVDEDQFQIIHGSTPA
jgi:hypothetical protein